MQAIKKGHLSTVVRALELFFLVIISIKRREAFSEGGLENLCAHHAALSPFSQWGNVVAWNRCLWDSGVGTSCIKQGYHQFHSIHIAIFLFHFFFTMKYIMISSPTDCVPSIGGSSARQLCLEVVTDAYFLDRAVLSLHWNKGMIRWMLLFPERWRYASINGLICYAFSGDYVRWQAHTI